MKKDLTEIVMVIDESGSMFYLKDDVVGGINTFIKEQKDLPGEANLTIVKFDTSYNIFVNGKDLKEVDLLTEEDYSPHGGTALLDAVGKAIDTVGKRLAETDENDRPEKVVFVITTDGEENSSREYSGDIIKEKVKHQTDVYDWEFIFTGANIDSFSVGGSIGFNNFNTANYANNSKGINAMYSSLNKSVAATRGVGLKKSMKAYMDEEESK